jgi:CRP-like cAMP-binding protein
MNPRSRSTGLTGGDGSAAPSISENSLIGSLPANERAEFEQRTTRVTCSLREILFEPNEPLKRLLFPISAMGSMLTILKDGTLLEAMTVGHEGFMGLPVFHGISVARCRGVCQIEGEFYELSPRDFLSLVENAPYLRSRIHRYAQFTTEVIAQTAACNGIHLIEQRCARWLLLTADAVRRKEFSLTQELLSQMLAVRRPGVTVAIGALERQGLIEHRYGRVSIADFEGLKKVSCECYQTIADKARELLT